MTNVIVLNTGSLGRMATPDYYEDRAAAQSLVDKLKYYYHSRGFHKVNVWLEPEETFSGRRMWNIRSTIHFKVPELS